MFKRNAFLLAACIPSILLASNVSFQKDVAYLGPDRAEKMDVYTPKGASSTPRPAVLWIHGGGWVGGNKLSKREKTICKSLAEEGYVAFSIDYRLGSYKSKTLPGGGVDVPWPQNIYDCKSALRFIRKEATRFGVDPDRIAVAGGSAGGHLALLVGVSEDVDALNQGRLYTEQSNAVACIVDFYGIVEVEGAPHSFDLQPEQMDLRPALFEFLATYLK